MSDDWQPELGQDYETVMRRAREAREARAANAGNAVLRYLWPQLSPRETEKPAEDIPLELVRWSVRGELRRREDFGRPHRDDFTGGLPLPDKYPRHPDLRR